MAALLVALPLLVAPTALQAQDPGAKPGAPRPAHVEDGPQPTRLTLDDALRMAEENNPAYRRAENDAALNGIEMRTTWLTQLLPRASLTLFNTGFTGNLQRRALDPFGNPIANPGADWRYFSNSSQQLSLQWSFQGLSIFHMYRQQQLVNQGRDAARVEALTGLQVEVQRLYMDALEQRDLMEAEQELLEARRLDLEVAQRLFQMALRTRVDVLNAELEIEQQGLELRRQEAAYERALLALGAELGSEDFGGLELADEPLPIFDPSSLDADELVATAFEVNPTLRRTSASVREAQVGLSMQHNAWWPEVRAGVNLFRVSRADYEAALFDATPGDGIEGSFSLGLSIPIFNDFFQTRRATEQASVTLDNQREADREARLQIEETVRGGVLELSNQWEQLRLAERSLEIAEEALRLAREEYRLGSRSFAELRLVFEQEAETRRQVITARHAFVDALLSLEEAVGTSIRGRTPPVTGGS